MTPFVVTIPLEDGSVVYVGSPNADGKLRACSCVEVVEGGKK